MTREEYFRAVARKIMEIKALADNYEEGNERLDIWVTKAGITIANGKDSENHYSFMVPTGCDIENGEIYEWMIAHFAIALGEF